MNFKQYFDQIEVKPTKSDKNVSKKMVQNKIFANKLNKLLSVNLIDMPDHSFALNFIKSKGNITNSKKYFNFYNSLLINEKIDPEDKEEIKIASRCLFVHLHDLFGDGIKNMSEMNVDNLIKNIEEYNKNSFSFTQDQRNSIKSMCYFLYDSSAKTFGLYGFAGTGKTTTITKFIHYLLYKNYINSVVLTAPTNVAVNVIKSKFRSDLDDLVRSKIKGIMAINESFDDVLYKLEDNGINIKFMTIHKLLNYQNDFDIEGERIFIKGDNASLDNYDIVIIDECSMIPTQIIANIFEEANKSELLVRRPKNVIFLGDPAQINPVGEGISIIFASKPTDFNFDLYKNAYLINSNKNVDENLLKIIHSKFDILQKQILGMNYVTLKQVMRSNNDQVIGVCNEVRAAVLKEIRVPNLGKFKGNKVFLYKYDIKTKKIETPWFKKAIEYFSVTNDMSNIILAWTNKQTDEYNDAMRRILHKKTNLNKYEIGDILMLTDFYNIKDEEKQSKYKKGLIDNDVFYTSEQIKITDIEHAIKGISEFTENLSGIDKIKNSIDIKEKYIRSIKSINKNTVRKYNAWKLHVHKLSEIVVDKTPETHVIYVVNDNSAEQLKKDREFVANSIKELRTYYKNYHKENLMTIDKLVIRLLWKEVNQKLVDPFAKVNQSASCTTHKSQSGSFYNVFVDMDDIFKNNNLDEALRLLYTSMSRTRNELHMSIRSK